MNNFFIEKVKQISSSFTQNIINPLDILKILKPRNINTFTLPQTNIKEVTKYISDLKTSNALGHNQLNSKTLKKFKI